MASQPAATTRTAGEPAWRQTELSDPHAHGDKARKVRTMFAAIARSYDLNNRVHSLWMDQLWRRYAVRVAGVKPGDVVVDVACGTGDLTEAFAKRSPAKRVIGIDYTPQMLDLARVKQTKKGIDTGRVEYREGDAMNLDLPDNSADVLSIAFGIRNVREPEVAFGEFARVLRPGGRLVVLEFDTPRLAPVRIFNDFYSGWVMPRTATLISRDKSGAYRYLPKSVQTFATRDRMIEMIEGADFETPRVRSLSMGICACYRAVR
ncbi:MAG: bifunctional demethylmenaquinone methyltransferase/2-methoxy-6-polyprenyl-1,4-benzoquinol methylase UbiE [Planctomycetota bacterium]